MMFFPGRRGGSLPKVSQVLTGRSIGHVILVVGKSLVTHQADVIKSLISALAKTQVILWLGLHTLSQEDVPLKSCRDLCSGKTQPGLGHIDKAHKSLHG